MKTAISVDDALLAEADAAARELGMSRSGLISEALRRLLQERRSARITDQLNKVYADKPSRDERALVKKLRTKIPVMDRW